MRKIQKHITLAQDILDRVRFILNGYESIIKNMAVSSARLREFDFGQFYNFVALLACKQDSEDFDNEILYPLGEYQIDETGETDGNVETLAAEIQDMIIEIMEESEAEEAPLVDEPDEVDEFVQSVNGHDFDSASRQDARMQALAGWHHVQECPIPRATMGASL